MKDANINGFLYKTERQKYVLNVNHLIGIEKEVIENKMKWYIAAIIVGIISSGLVFTLYSANILTHNFEQMSNVPKDEIERNLLTKAFDTNR